MTQTFKQQARRLLDTRTVLAFIAGFLCWQLLMAVWHVLLPLAIVVIGVWLVVKYVVRDID